jgi:hypothetical protein
MESGAMRRSDPDTASHFLWSLVHGIVTLAMTCRLHGCEGCRGDAETSSPLEMFEAFRPYIRYGLRQPTTD